MGISWLGTSNLAIGQDPSQLKTPISCVAGAAHDLADIQLFLLETEPQSGQQCAQLANNVAPADDLLSFGNAAIWGPGGGRQGTSLRYTPWALSL